MNNGHNRMFPLRKYTLNIVSCEASPVRAFLYPKKFPLNVNSQLPF